jgi:N6-L-threonylcarbamoyladenine synthase
MLVLGIESTCDETAASVVKDGKETLSQVISSQVDLHEIFGGVVPELACRRHMEVIIPVIRQAVDEAAICLEQVDLIAVAYGPGLVGPLMIGVNTAKALALSMNKPVVGVNHVEAHLYAAIMSAEEEIQYPVLGMIVSGGHTAIVLVESLGQYRLIGQTVDDALGEAFDKVAKMLGLAYPGGPIIEKLAEGGDPHRFALKAGICKNNPLNFSFSGLKTAVLYAMKGHDATDLQFQKDLSASFQRAALSDLIHKARKAAKETGCKGVLFGGGVTNNMALRKMFADEAPELKCHFPTRALSLDNATMIAGLGYHVFLSKGPADLKTLDAVTRIPF